ncbi:hypothetical protein SLOPH_1044 [Spraguea lophii 42_110]|uniref:Uncharacterized protein n=1 Tax=Spraguea lophii (strain 42_110) TaxID=1358809 RepID=S7WAA8_SPRLO|nr:hypothetical protein SLOPH_1044 [Spraguea lophii 42_110]
MLAVDSVCTVVYDDCLRIIDGDILKALEYTNDYYVRLHPEKKYQDYFFINIKINNGYSALEIAEKLKKGVFFIDFEYYEFNSTAKGYLYVYLQNSLGIVLKLMVRCANNYKISYLNLFLEVFKNIKLKGYFLPSTIIDKKFKNPFILFISFNVLPHEVKSKKLSVSSILYWIIRVTSQKFVNYYEMGKFKSSYYPHISFLSKKYNIRNKDGMLKYYVIEGELKKVTVYKIGITWKALYIDISHLLLGKNKFHVTIAYCETEKKMTIKEILKVTNIINSLVFLN